MSKISKTTYTFTVLHLTEDRGMSLHEAIEEAEVGNAVGGETSGPVTVPVADEEVPAELRALGNDGSFFESFFDDDLEEA